MLNTLRGRRGMVTAPHHLAAEAGLAVLRDGGNAIEAAIAAAATIAVVYPHMTALGGDGFWLISEPGQPPIAIDASGTAAALATPALYQAAGLDAIPTRGPLAALTVPGTIGGWQIALQHSARLGGKLPLARLLADARHYAADGYPATRSQTLYTTAKLDGLVDQPGFATTYLADGAVPQPGQIVRNPALADMLTRLGEAGLEDFYRGDIGATLGADLAAAGSPLRTEDFAGYRAREVAPLKLNLPQGTVYNLPPPCQGVASLKILGIFARLNVEVPDTFHHIHGLVEATKLAFALRDQEVGDPDAMRANPADWLASVTLAEDAAAVNPQKAAPWGQKPGGGDTIWLATADADGRMVSFIQSIYWEFGSGVVSPRTGVVLQNRGAAFVLEAGKPRSLAPGRRPFHTLNPAFAVLKDGRRLAYGTMGGDGQPQTQAAIFTRHVLFGQDLQAAITAPRWLLGRTWGDSSVSLKLENRIDERVIAGLRLAGHDVEIVDGFSDMMGHAGAIALAADGVLSGATDPRSDGQVAAF